MSVLRTLPFINKLEGTQQSAYLRQDPTVPFKSVNPYPKLNSAVKP